MKKRRKGQSIVEFAILVPILLLVLIAIIEFGLMFNSYLILQTSARDAARQLSIGVSDTEVTSQIKAQAYGIDLAQLSISISPTEATRIAGDDVTVELIYTHTIITPFLAAITGPTVPLDVKVVMRVE